MIVLGVHYGHDSNASIVKDGKVIFAIAEERLNRKKLYRGFPFLSIQSALENTGLKPSDIDKIALVNLNAQEEALGGNLATFYSRLNKSTPIRAEILSPFLSLCDNLLGTTLRRKIAKKLVLNTLVEMGFSEEKISCVDHHLSHAAGAFFLSGFPVALIFTSDGKGDHVSHRTYLVKDNAFKKLAESWAHDSAGFFYSCITAYLGFKKLRHEGKITGLAAYGNFNEVSNIPSPLQLKKDLLKIRNTLISDKEAENILRVYFKLMGEDLLLLFNWLIQKSAIMAEYSQYRFEQFFEDVFRDTAREHVAAYAQHHLEEVIVSMVKEVMKSHRLSFVCLSGGTFGNVRLNQKISEIDGVDAVYIQPAMGDGGLSVGGALWEYWHNQNPWAHEFMEMVYLGPSFNNGNVEEELKKKNLQYEYVENIEKTIAEYLVKEKIVGRFCGAMEWGPRALGNRSILANSKDKSINDTLNKRLGRTEFMPFAPIVMEERAAQYFKGYKPDDLASRFMTITYDVFEEKINQIPAVVHVDGTARPQVVRSKDNKSLHKILKEYEKLTGIPVLINTSFNMHEEPIVCSPGDAIRAFHEGAVDVLAIENFLVWKD